MFKSRMDPVYLGALQKILLLLLMISLIFASLKQSSLLMLGPIIKIIMILSCRKHSSTNKNKKNKMKKEKMKIVKKNSEQ